jgi:hypothetical protein
MANLAKTWQELRKERDRTQGQLEKLDQAVAVIGTLVGRNSAGTHRTVRKVRRTMSAAARRNIAAAQRVRWAKWKAKHVLAQPEMEKRRYPLV